MPEDPIVSLRLPAQAENVSLARLLTAAIASRLEFDIERVEDLRIAVDELCYLLVGSSGRPGMMTLTFTASADGLEVIGEGPLGEHGVEFADLSEQILESIVDEYAVQANGDQVTFRMVCRHKLHA